MARVEPTCAPLTSPSSCASRRSFCGVLPALVLISVFAAAVGDDSVAFDFRVFLSAAHAVLHGDRYPSWLRPTRSSAGYVYPPLTALVSVPFTASRGSGRVDRDGSARGGCARGSLGHRRARLALYGVLLLWPPVISGIQTGSVTLAIALCRGRMAVPRQLCAGILHCYRRHASRQRSSSGRSWCGSRRRGVSSAVSALAIGVGLLLASWARSASRPRGLPVTPAAAAGRGGLTYTAYIVGLDLGLPSAVARAVWLAVGLAALASVVALARRGDEQTAFVVAIVASLALTPIVWLHYFALLLVVVAVARPSSRSSGSFRSDGRHAGERSSERRSRPHGRWPSLSSPSCWPCASRAAAPRVLVGRGESVTTSSVADVKGPARSMRHVGARARVGPTSGSR